MTDIIPINRGAVVVTGASSGMGRACALLLAQAGYHVFAGVRKEQDALALKQQAPASLTPIFLDVTDADSITAAAMQVTETVGEAGLTGLVNCAGIGVTAPMELLPITELRRQFEINVIGQVAVTQAFLPLIRAARGRIIHVGSVGGKITIPFGGPLCASKYAIESINDALRMELALWGIEVCLIAPGSIRTPAVGKLVKDSEAMISTFPEEGARRYAAAYRAFVQTFVKHEEAGACPEVMAAVVLKALTARLPRTRYPVGPLSRRLPWLSRVLPPRVFDRVKARLFGLPRYVEA
ncbi:SDR family oxidoreductase [Dictyobacter aurantiacus]|uniref:Short-chain dehydrogenase n=1 Tax=Dictyobacter aurantiacus TaxID=1936993 RepID=A0A401ZT65_9CHLR|nr:SDR family oxidoreductase [Dictyobacter aurantiacus]GCE10057.1 short-chain dehydrogenase [Dictyobacter aurantiacus]